MGQYEDFLAYFQNDTSEEPIDQTRSTLARAIEWFREQPEQQDYIKTIASYRKLSVEILNQANTFFFDNSMALPPEFTTEDVALNNFGGRFCYPIYNSSKVPVGLTGWDKFSNAKYLDSRTYGYMAKHTVMFGMENMQTYYESDKPVIFVEGPVCALTLRDNGFQALALLGSSLPAYYVTIIKRFGNRAIVIPDSDSAGNYLARQVALKLPTARLIRVESAKDVDDSRLANPHFFTNLAKVVNNPFCSYTL